VTTAVSAVAASEDAEIRGSSAKFKSLYEELLTRARAHDQTNTPNDLSGSAALDQSHPKIKVESGEEPLGPLASALSFAGPGGRPYFSSLRKESSESAPASQDEARGDHLESVLPKGIWTSTVIPVRGNQDRPRTSQPSTLGDLYQKSKRLAGLRPPLDPVAATTRGLTVGWYHPKQFPSSRMVLAGNFETYSNQCLPAGTWLAGSKMPSAPVILSKERPKLGERRKSAEDPQQEESEQDREQARWATKRFEKERRAAAFKGAYSHFAPSYDNTRSVVPQQHRSRLWWNWRVASLTSSFQELSAAQSADESDVVPEETIDPALDDKLIQEAIESFEDDSNSQDVEHTLANGTESTTRGDQDTEEILESISEMLEGLSSYQRNRHSELRSKHTSADELGTPSKPSSAEFDLHRMLRDQLAVVVSSLPPFAAARLNGDQLKELNIKPQLELEEAVYHGVLDEETRPSTHHAHGIAGTGQRHPSLSSARPSSYTGLPAASSAARGSFSAPRPSSSTYHPGQAPSRPPGYGVYQHQLSQGPPRPSQSSYSQSPFPGQGVIQPSTHRANPTVNGYSTSNSNHTPMPPRTPQYSGPNMQAPQQRPGQPSPYGGRYGVQHGRATSPQQAHQAAQSTYGAASQMSPTRPTYGQYPQSAVSPPRAGAALSNGVGTIGAQIQMSAEERALIASRQHHQQHQQQQHQQHQWQQSQYQQQYQQLQIQHYRQQQQQQQQSDHQSPPSHSSIPKPASSPSIASPPGYNSATGTRPKSSGENGSQPVLNHSGSTRH
jgi:hypothetical protein